MLLSTIEIIITCFFAVFSIIAIFLALKRGRDIHRLNTILEHLTHQHAHAQIQLNDKLSAQQHVLSEALTKRFDYMNERVGGSLTQLRERLSVIDHAQKSMADLGKQVIDLKHIFTNKQMRGAFGEIQLHDLVTSLLPSSAYRFQESLSTGKRPDCLLNFPEPTGAMAIDAKFPLESYRRYTEAQNETDKLVAQRQLKIDFQKHITDIHEKYIIPGETADSALMFLPSERIYADLHTDFTDIVDYAFKAHVFIVSPTTLMATLNTMRSILKNSQMHEEAKLIQREMGLFLKDAGLMQDRMTKLETHFTQAQEDIRLLRISTDKIARRAENIESLEMKGEEQFKEAG